MAEGNSLKCTLVIKDTKSSQKLLDDFFDDFFDFPVFDDKAMQKAQRKLYGRHAANMMKTDVQEHDDHYEVDIDLPGFRKDELSLELQDGYMVISAAKGQDKLLPFFML